MAAVASMPVFTASPPMSASTASIWATTNSAGATCTAVTATVFCAVSAVMRRGAVDAERREGLEVGLDAGAAARVAAGDCQRRSHVDNIRASMPHYRAASSPALSLVDAAAERAVPRLASHGVRAGAVLFAAALTGAAAQFASRCRGRRSRSRCSRWPCCWPAPCSGPGWAPLSQVLYLALGVTGASMFALSPVLAPGVARLLGPDRRLPAGVPARRIRHADGSPTAAGRASYAGAVATLVAGLVVLYAGGASWLAALAGPASVATLWPFVAADLVKVAAAAAALPTSVRALDARR